MLGLFLLVLSLLRFITPPFDASSKMEIPRVGDDVPELAVLDYLAVQIRILPLLTTTFAFITPVSRCTGSIQELEQLL
jgi:hypothetical protein